MVKPHYADYVNMMVRRYALEEQLFGYVNEFNHKCVNEELTRLTEIERNAILDMFRRKDTLTDNIYAISREQCIRQDELWTLLTTVTKRIAVRRGLI